MDPHSESRRYNEFVQNCKNVINKMNLLKIFSELPDDIIAQTPESSRELDDIARSLLEFKIKTFAKESPEEEYNNLKDVSKFSFPKTNSEISRILTTKEKGTLNSDWSEDSFTYKKCLREKNMRFHFDVNQTLSEDFQLGNNSKKKLGFNKDENTVNEFYRFSLDRRYNSLNIEPGIKTEKERNNVKYSKSNVEISRNAKNIEKLPETHLNLPNKQENDANRKINTNADNFNEKIYFDSGWKDASVIYSASLTEINTEIIGAHDKPQQQKQTDNIVILNEPDIINLEENIIKNSRSKTENRNNNIENSINKIDNFNNHTESFIDKIGNANNWNTEIKDINNINNPQNNIEKLNNHIGHSKNDTLHRNEYCFKHDTSNYVATIDNNTENVENMHNPTQNRTTPGHTRIENKSITDIDQKNSMTDKKKREINKDNDNKGQKEVLNNMEINFPLKKDYLVGNAPVNLKETGNHSNPFIIDNEIGPITNGIKEPTNQKSNPHEINNEYNKIKETSEHIKWDEDSLPYSASFMSLALTAKELEEIDTKVNNICDNQTHSRKEKYKILKSVFFKEKVSNLNIENDCCCFAPVCWTRNLNSYKKQSKCNIKKPETRYKFGHNTFIAMQAVTTTNKAKADDEEDDEESDDEDDEDVDVGVNTDALRYRNIRKAKNISNTKRPYNPSADSLPFELIEQNIVKKPEIIGKNKFDFPYEPSLSSLPLAGANAKECKCSDSNEKNNKTGLQSKREQDDNDIPANVIYLNIYNSPKEDSETNGFKADDIKKDGLSDLLMKLCLPDDTLNAFNQSSKKFVCDNTTPGLMIDNQENYMPPCPQYVICTEDINSDNTTQYVICDENMDTDTIQYLICEEDTDMYAAPTEYIIYEEQITNVQPETEPTRSPKKSDSPEDTKSISQSPPKVKEDENAPNSIKNGENITYPQNFMQNPFNPFMYNGLMPFNQNQMSMKQSSVCCDRDICDQSSESESSDSISTEIVEYTMPEDEVIRDGKTGCQRCCIFCCGCCVSDPISDERLRKPEFRNVGVNVKTKYTCDDPCSQPKKNQCSSTPYKCGKGSDGQKTCQDVQAFNCGTANCPHKKQCLPQYNCKEGLSNAQTTMFGTNMFYPQPMMNMQPFVLNNNGMGMGNMPAYRFNNSGMMNMPPYGTPGVSNSIPPYGLDNNIMRNGPPGAFNNIPPYGSSNNCVRNRQPSFSKNRCMKNMPPHRFGNSNIGNMPGNYGIQQQPSYLYGMYQQPVPYGFGTLPDQIYTPMPNIHKPTAQNSCMVQTQDITTSPQYVPPRVCTNRPTYEEEVECPAQNAPPLSKRTCGSKPALCPVKGEQCEEDRKKSIYVERVTYASL